MSSTLVRDFTVSDPIHGEVRCLELAPSMEGPLPVCLFLYGGGGSAQTLLEVRPLLEEAWNAQTLRPCRVVTPEVGPFSFYLDDPTRGSGWESFVSQRLLDAVSPNRAVGVVGISMGGYGALKLGFTRPERFGAIAAVSPMVEPALSVDQVRARNRFHYPPEVPAALLGPERDPQLYAADHPAQRARAHADRIRAAAPAIYIDAASRDALNAHDGAEFLHRVLWELDLVHEYRLHADADHVGPTVPGRLMSAFSWVLDQIASPPRPLDELEEAWCDWLDAGCRGEPPPPLSPISPIFPRVLRSMIASGRQEAAREDPSVVRTYGPLPGVPPSNDGSRPGEHPALGGTD